VSWGQQIKSRPLGDRFECLETPHPLHRLFQRSGSVCQLALIQITPSLQQAGSPPPLQGSLREDLQKGGPQAGADFLKPYFIAVARMLTKAEEKG